MTLNLAAALQAEGYEIDILLMGCEGEFLEEARRQFWVIALLCNRTWRLPWRLLNYLRLTHPSALIASFWKLNLCACLSRLGAPAVQLILGEHSPSSRSRNSPTWICAITASLLYPLATRVVAVPNGVVENVRRITLGLGGMVRTIYNPIPAPRVVRTDSNEVGGRRLLWVGHLDVPEKPWTDGGGFRAPAQGAWLYAGYGRRRANAPQVGTAGA